MTLIQLIYLVHQLSILHFLRNLETCWFVDSQLAVFDFQIIFLFPDEMLHQELFFLAVVKHPGKSASNFFPIFRVPLGTRNQKNAHPPTKHKRESERSEGVRDRK